MSRCSTGFLQRQQTPPSACSLASTVWHDGHQFTGALRAVGDPLLQHAQEEPLVPAVVLRVAGGDLAAPGVAEAEPLELALHRGDVGPGPLLRVDPLLDRGVLGRQAERVPPDRVQHVHPAHGLAARDHVGDAVVADVPHVDVARRVGQHLEAVELGPLRVLRDLESPALGPDFLPARLDLFEVVVAHQLNCRKRGSLARRPFLLVPHRPGARSEWDAKERHLRPSNELRRS